MSCPRCRHEVGPRARFCEACGAPVPEAAAGGAVGSDAVSRARVYAALPVLVAFLQREGRVSYRVLAHVFNGDPAFLDEVREELTFRRLARDEHGQGLVWTGERTPALAPSADLLRAQLAPPSPAAGRLPAGPAPAPEAIGQPERRQLTVMFCDLADSTVLAGRLDAEDLREVIRSYQATAAEVVQHFGGHIAQYLGDGLLVYLGWPEAHEDDASRAVHAGLGIVEAMATTLNPRLTRDKGVRLSVRVGIHTGPELDAASGRALALCRALGDRETLFPTLYVRWAAKYVLGHQNEVHDLSSEYSRADTRGRRRRRHPPRQPDARGRAAHAW